jgi:nucleoside-diphosphate-sugar epimerase
MNIVINGGTGWLGIATLRALERIKYIENIEITSSNGRTFIAHDLGEFKTKELTNNTKIDFKTEVLVNLAFKTRDYISILGEEEYTKINLDILKSSVNLAKNLKPKSIVIVSSGVVSRNLDSQGKLDNTQYTKLKNLEEKTFTQIAKDMGANLVILRMWGGSGRDLTSPFKYAIGDLIRQALVSDKIIVSSEQLTYRRYSDASQQLEIAIRCAISGKNLVFDSGGQIIEMGELANIIKNTLQPNLEIVRKLDANLPADKYYSESNQFESFAKEYGIELFTLKQQIIETKVSVNRAL